MIRFRAGDTNVRVHALALLMLALSFALGARVELAAMLTALFAHEGAHLLAARLLRVRVEALDLMPFGGALTLENPYRLGRWQLFGVSLAGPLSNLLGATLRAMGDSRTPLVSLAVSTLVNIALDVAFIALLGLGVRGAALATLISRAVDVGVCVRGVKRSGAAWPRRSDWRWERRTVRELMRLGFPQLLSYGVCATGELYVQAAINRFGIAFVTGMTAAKRYFSLINVVGGGIEGAVATFVGQNYGARQPRRIALGTRQATWLALGSSLTITALVALLSRPLILAFIPTAAPDVVQTGVDALRVQVCCLWGLYLLCMYRAALQGMGNALAPMISGFLELVLRLATAFALPRIVGATGLYWTDAVTWLVTAAMLMASYFVSARKRLARLDR